MAAKKKKKKKIGRYRRVIEHVFSQAYQLGMESIPFTREDLSAAGQSLGLVGVKNLGDLIYTFRFRQPMPLAIRKTAKQDHVWIIRLSGSAKYRFSMIPEKLAYTHPRSDIIPTKIPDSTPG